MNFYAGISLFCASGFFLCRGKTIKWGNTLEYIMQWGTLIFGIDLNNCCQLFSFNIMPAESTQAIHVWSDSFTWHQPNFLPFCLCICHLFATVNNLYVLISQMRLTEVSAHVQIFWTLKTNLKRNQSFQMWEVWLQWIKCFYSDIFFCHACGFSI